MAQGQIADFQKGTASGQPRSGRDLQPFGLGQPPISGQSTLSRAVDVAEDHGHLDRSGMGCQPRGKFVGVHRRQEEDAAHFLMGADGRVGQEGVALGPLRYSKAEDGETSRVPAASARFRSLG